MPEPHALPSDPGLSPFQRACPLLLGLTGFVLSWAALALSGFEPAVPILGPTAGLALAAFVRLGLRCWWGLFLAAVGLGLVLDLPPALAVVLAVGSLTGPVVLERLLGPSLRQGGGSSRARAFRLLGAVALTMALPALVGSWTLVAWGELPAAAAPRLMLDWWIDDALGGLLFGSLLLSLDRQVLRATLRPATLFGALLVCFVTLGLAFLAFHDGGSLPALLGLYVVVALASSFHPRAVSAAVLVPVYFQALAEAGEASGLAVGVQGLTAIEVTLMHVGAMVLLQYLVATIVGDHLGEREALAESELRNRELMEAVGDAIYVVDDRGIIVDANEVAWSRLGWTRDQLIGRPVTDVDTQHDEGEVLEASEITVTEGLPPFETEHRRADGSTFPVEVHLSPFHRAGRMGVVAVARDLSSRRAEQQALVEKEARLRTIFEHEPECVKLVSEDLRLLDMNPAGLEMVAADGIDAVRGADLRQLLAPEHVELFEEGVAAVFRGETTFQVFEIIDLAGERHWMEQHSAPLWDPDDPTRVKEMLAVTRDITERKRAEEQGLHRQRLEALGTLASGIAHDLNNLLAPIMLSIGELDGVRGLDPGLVKTLEGSVLRAADMVRQLLSFSRGLEGESRPLDPLDLLDELDRIVRATFPKSIRLELDPPRATEPIGQVVGDPTQLHQVLLNLCVNARDAMGDAGGRLTVGLRRVHHAGGAVPGPLAAEPGDYLVLSVADTGEGIPAEQLERIFEPFYSTKGPDRGTGLGLSSAIGIVAAHGGFVTVESEPGSGTRFEVYLPAAKAESELPGRGGHQLALEGGGRKVLVVDDEEAVLDMALRVIRRLGFDPLGATSGEGGLEVLEELGDAVDLVLSDLRMPGMGGSAFLTEARRLHPDLPLVLTTGHMDPAALEHLARLEGLVRLEKPYSISDLQGALRQALG